MISAIGSDVSTWFTLRSRRRGLGREEALVDTLGVDHLSSVNSPLPRAEPPWAFAFVLPCRLEDVDQIGRHGWSLVGRAANERLTLGVADRVLHLLARHRAHGLDRTIFDQFWSGAPLRSCCSAPQRSQYVRDPP